MKKAILSLTLFGLLVLPLIVGAVTPTATSPSGVAFPEMLDRISDWLLGILLAIAVIFLIVAGFFFVTAQGDPDKIEKARKFVLYALIGVIVGVASYALVNFIQTVLK